MNFQELNKTLRAFIRVGLDLPENRVRPGNHAGKTAPQNELFATVLITDITPTGHLDHVHHDRGDTLSEEVVGQHKVTASIQFYGPHAMITALRLKSYLETDTATTQLAEMGLGVVNTSALRNLSQVSDATWEERGQFDFSFHILAGFANSVHYFKSFEFVIHCEHSTKHFEVNP